MDMCGSSPEYKLILAEPFSTVPKYEDIKATKGQAARLTWRKEIGARLVALLLPTACLRVRIESIDIYQKSIVGRSVADPGC
jgi:hypothetical protein